MISPYGSFEANFIEQFSDPYTDGFWDAKRLGAVISEREAARLNRLLDDDEHEQVLHDLELCYESRGPYHNELSNVPDEDPGYTNYLRGFINGAADEFWGCDGYPNDL
jgi:hypothetical protein